MKQPLFELRRSENSLSKPHTAFLSTGSEETDGETLDGVRWIRVRLNDDADVFLQLLMDFSGKYQLESHENFEAFMKAVGERKHTLTFSFFGLF